jgi:phospholipase C
VSSSDESPINTPLTRRRFLTGAAALAATAGIAAYLPDAVKKAIAATPQQPFELSQIKHVVFLMQENRSFDHYFGTMPGVRGFSDPNPLMLSTGRNVFYQPDPSNPLGYLLPFRANSVQYSGQALMSLSHAWEHQHACWNEGAMDGWVRTHVMADTSAAGPYTMGYYEQEDIPFHWALANAFTLCDNYHCSIMGPTDPNRTYYMTGMIDPTGTGGGPLISNSDLNISDPFGWTTEAEFLQNAGVPWKIYQSFATEALWQSGGQPTSLTTYGDNCLNEGYNLFREFSGPQAWAPGGKNADPQAWARLTNCSTLWGPNGDGTTLSGQDSSKINPYTGQPFTYLESFEEDCFDGNLPTVSWLLTYGEVTEHPNFLPAAGAEFIANKITAMAANPDIWNSTVFVLNYDENDGRFDHVNPPTPPAGTADEFVTLPSRSGTYGMGYPIGLGFRVPCMVVSPWTTGGYVASEVFDHTSTLQLIEQVCAANGYATANEGDPGFNTNISAWRRQNCGDMTSVFQTGTVASQSPADPTNSNIDPNFTDATNTANLNTQIALESAPFPPIPRVAQTVPEQQPGTKTIIS